MKMVVTILTIMLSATAWPQAADTSGTNPASRTAGPSSADVSLVKQLAMGGTAEVAAGKVASARAQNQKVKEFGQQMVTDHSKTNNKLMALAKAKKIEVQAKPNSEHAAKLAELEKLSGNAFDKKYMDSQVEAHQKTVLLLQHAIDGGQDSEIRQFVTETLPVVTHHLQMAKQLQASLSGSGHRSQSDKAPTAGASAKTGSY